MRTNNEGKTILTRDEAVALAAFLMHDMQRYVEEIQKTRSSLINIGLSSDIKLEWPDFILSGKPYLIDNVPLNIPRIDPKKISVEKWSVQLTVQDATTKEK
jgi:hypothetical protein